MRFKFYKLNIVWLFILIAISTSCQFRVDKNYADDLKGCLTNDDIEVLNKATYLFEQKLKKHYKSTDNNSNFLNYLEDLSSIQNIGNFKLDFYLNSESFQVIKELEDKVTFDKIWIQFIDDKDDDEIPIAVISEGKEHKKETLNIYSLNPYGDYLNCLNKNHENEEIKALLNSQSNYGNISPSIIASAFQQKFNKGDFNNELNKVIVAIGFYYDTVNLLQKNQR